MTVERERATGTTSVDAVGSEPQEGGNETPAFVEHLLRPQAANVPGGDVEEAIVRSWSESVGVLGDGRVARQSASCLLRPGAGDRVLVWPGHQGAWVLAVLERADPDSAAVLATDASVRVQAPSIALLGQAVHIDAEDFLTRADNRHAVEGTRTESCKVRVSQVGTDIRRATTADDMVEGTLIQRSGTWISNTVRDARMRARTFLFS